MILKVFFLSSYRLVGRLLFEGVDEDEKKMAGNWNSY